MFNEWFIDFVEKFIFSFMITNQNASTKESCDILSYEVDPNFLLKHDDLMNDQVDQINSVI